MGFFDFLTNKIIGKVEDEVITDVKDGVVQPYMPLGCASAKASPSEPTIDRSDEIRWETSRKSFVLWLVNQKKKKKETTEEYAYAVGSYGIDPADLTPGMILRRNVGLSDATHRAKLTALRWYAMYLLEHDQERLYVTLGKLNKEQKSED